MARQSIIKGGATARADSAKNSKMPTPKPPVDRDDQPEPPPSPLVLQTMITEFHIQAGDAQTASRKAEAVLRKMKPYLTDEQAQDLYEVAGQPIDTWGIVREMTTAKELTYADLNDLIDQTKGGS